MRLLIVDDQATFAEALAIALSNRHTIVATISDPALISPYLDRDPNPDLVLLDSTLPHSDIFSMIRQIHTVHRIPVLVMSMYASGSDWPGLRRMGALGMLSKRLPLETFIAELDRLAALEKPADDGDPKNHPRAPTGRQLDVLICLARGQTIKQIAAAIHCSEARVREVLREFPQALGVTGRGAFVARAIELGWIEPRVPPPSSPPPQFGDPIVLDRHRLKIAVKSLWRWSGAVRPNH